MTSESPGKPISPRLQRLSSDLQDNPAALQSFWEEIQQAGTPIMEPDTAHYSWVTFVWREDSSARNIAVLQDWGADGIREHHMVRLPGSDVWYVTRRMHSDTRTTYQLSPSTSDNRDDPGGYTLDPLNPKTHIAYLSEERNNILFSLLELPDAPALPWRQPHDFQAGTVELHQPFTDQRRLWTYVPPGGITTSCPLLVFFDGRLYKDMLKLPEMLDYLSGMGHIPPVAALMIDNIDRTELQCKPEYADYVVERILPWFRSQYPVSTDPLETTLIGNSFGGLGAVYLAYRHPNVFGTAFSQGGWFRWRPEGDTEHHWLAHQLAAAPQLPIRFWLQVGDLETALMSDGGPTQLEANQHMMNTLLTKDYFVVYQEYSGGHDSSSIEAPLAQGLRGILG